MTAAESCVPVRTVEDPLTASEPTAGPAPTGDAPAATDSTAVGRVLGTVDATPQKFHVALQPDACLQLDHVVITTRDVPGLGQVSTAGIVTAVTARHEGASFASDVFLISDGLMPAQVQETAEVTTTRVEPEYYVPSDPRCACPPRAGPGSRVAFRGRHSRDPASARRCFCRARSRSTAGTCDCRAHPASRGPA